MTFQDNLRHYREKAGYSQAKDFAAAIGVKYSTYIGYESQGKEPKYDTLRRIAEALNVSIDTLLGFSGVDRYEEYRQLLERSGCHVTETGEKAVRVDLPTEKSFVFLDKMSLCSCTAHIISEFDQLLTPAKIAYIPLALLRKIDYVSRDLFQYAIQEARESSTQDAPPDTAALIGKKILAASPEAQVAIDQIIRDDKKE